MGDVYIVHLPGERMFEFQFFAQKQRPDAFLAVAGYGDGCTSYISRRSMPQRKTAGTKVEAMIKKRCNPCSRLAPIQYFPRK